MLLLPFVPFVLCDRTFLPQTLQTIMQRQFSTKPYVRLEAYLPCRFTRSTPIQNLQRILGYAHQKDVTTDEVWAQINCISASRNLINVRQCRGVSTNYGTRCIRIITSFVTKRQRIICGGVFWTKIVGNVRNELADLADSFTR